MISIQAFDEEPTEMIFVVVNGRLEAQMCDLLGPLRKAWIVSLGLRILY